MAMQGTISQRLAYARSDQKLGLVQVAGRARVDPDRLQAFEAGTAALSTAAVVRVARVLGVDIERVDPSREVDDLKMFFRHGGVPDFRHEDSAPIVDALRDAARYATVLVWLGATPRLSAGLSVRPVHPPPHEDGYALAREVRRLIGNVEHPIDDVKRLLERDAGALVVRQSFHTNAVRAVTAKHASSGAVAVVLTAAPGGLVRRIDLAHELAHVLFDAPAADSDVWIDLEDPNVYEKDPVEQRARAFAAELLVPLAGLRARYGDPRPGDSLESAARLARDVRAEFRVTAHVAVNHLKDLGYVPGPFREALLEEEMRVEVEERLDENALTVALRAAVEDGLVSRARALELLGLTVFDELP